MVENTLDPSFVRINYETSLGAHTATIPVKSYTPIVGGNYGLQQRDGGGTVWGTAISDLCNLYKAFMHTTTTFTYAELWQYDSLTNSNVFLEYHAINVAGTAATATSSALQITFSYRTVGGGNGKLVLLDISGGIANNTRFKPPAYGAAAQLAIATFLASDDCWVYGRDNTFAKYMPLAVTKTNDHLRKRRLL